MSTDGASVWLISGISGAGKSAVSRRLASRFLRGAYISGDFLADMIVNGQIDPDGEPAEEAERQVRLHQRNSCLLARSFTEAGYEPVIDWVVRNRADFNVYVQNLDGLRLHFVVLAPTLETVARRKPDGFRRWAYLEPEMSRDLKGTGLWVDSSDMSVEETVEFIVDRRHDALLPIEGMLAEGPDC